MSERFLAAQADIEFRANTGAVERDVEKLRRDFRTSTQAMSDDTLKLAVAQDKLDKALLRHGPSSTQAKQAEVALRREMEQTANASKRFDRNLDENTRSLGRFSRGAVAGSGAMRGLGRSLAFASSAFLGGAGILYAIRSTIEASLAFESAFAGVRKTVDATEEEFGKLSEGIRGMSREIPIAATELAKITELGGQLGIANDALLKFTRTVADLGQTTDLTTEQAATAFAQFANITQLPQDQIDRLGAVTVDLGNNFATVESKIVDFGLRIAGAGKIIGFTEAQTLATAAAFSSLGIEAEAGGTAVSKVFISLATAVKSGNKDLETFARTAGMTSAEFRKLFQQDSAAAFTAFIEGLQRINKEGGNVFQVLRDLGLTDQRLMRAFVGMAGAGDLFRRALDRGSKAWQQNSALTQEATKRYATSESQLRIFRNQVTDLQKVIGDALTPALLNIVQPLGDWLDKTENLEEVQRKANQIVKDGEGIVRAFVAVVKEINSYLRPLIDLLGGTENAAKLLFTALAVRKFLAITGAVKGLNVAIALLGPTSVRSAGTSVIAMNTIGTAATANEVKVLSLRTALLSLGGISFGALAAGLGVAVAGAVAGVGVVKGLNELDPSSNAVEPSKQAKRIVQSMLKYGPNTWRKFWANLSPSMRKMVAAELRRLNRYDVLVAVGAANVGGPSTGSGGYDEGRIGGRAPGARTPPPPVPSGGGGGGGSRTLEDIRLDQARATRTRSTADDERFLREEKAVLERQIRVLERRKMLTKEQKEKLRGLYGDIARVQSELDRIADQNKRAADDKREAARDAIRRPIEARELRLVANREQAELTEWLSDDRKRTQALIAFYRKQEQNDQLTVKERRAFRAKRIKAQQDLKKIDDEIRDRRLGRREEKLQLAVDEAELTKATEDDIRAQRRLRDFYRRQAQDRANTERERREYRKKEIEASKRLQALKGDDGTGLGAKKRAADKGLTMEDFRRQAFDFLGSLAEVRAQYGSNIEMDGSGWASHSELAKQSRLMVQQTRATALLASRVAHPEARYLGSVAESLGAGPGAF